MKLDYIKVEENQALVFFVEEKKNEGITLTYKIEREERKLKLIPRATIGGVTRDISELFSLLNESEYQDIKEKAEEVLLADSRFSNYTVE